MKNPAGEDRLTKPILLLVLAGTLLSACAIPDASRDAAQNLQSTQPDRSARKVIPQAFSR